MISLIHPSRGRARLAYDRYSEWIMMADDYRIEYIVSIDNDDPQAELYEDSFVNVVRNDTNNVVAATNKAAKETEGDILIYVSDDFSCPNGWDTLVEKEFEGVTEPMLLKVDDCLQGFDVRVLTIPIMNRALYEKLGYFWHPEYKSMFVDEDLWWTCRNNGWLKKAPHLKFPHNHHSLGKCENDGTYRRSEANWNQGKAVFARRKAAGFPL